jgi:hypothetical protein
MNYDQIYKELLYINNTQAQHIYSYLTKEDIYNVFMRILLHYLLLFYINIKTLQSLSTHFNIEKKQTRKKIQIADY